MRSMHSSCELYAYGAIPATGDSRSAKQAPIRTATGRRQRIFLPGAHLLLPIGVIPHDRITWCAVGRVSPINH